MILHIKSVLGGYSVKDESGDILYSIKREKFLGPARLVIKDEEVLYKTDIVNEDGKIRYIVKDEKDGGDKTVIESRLRFEDEKESLIYHPKVESMLLSTKYGEIKAIQNKDMSVYFVHEDIVIGKISPFLSIRSQVLACSEKFPVVLWVILYILSYYMIHESDLITV